MYMVDLIYLYVNAFECCASLFFTAYCMQYVAVCIKLFNFSFGRFSLCSDTTKINIYTAKNSVHDSLYVQQQQQQHTKTHKNAFSSLYLQNSNKNNDLK